jgi:hypothetical protein
MSAPMKKVIKHYTAARTAIGGREPTPFTLPFDLELLLLLSTLLEDGSDDR